MTEYLEQLEEVNQAIKVFCDATVMCDTCVHCIDRTSRRCFCDITDSMAGGWNLKTSGCEQHMYQDPDLQQEFNTLLSRWAELHLIGYPVDDE